MSTNAAFEWRQCNRHPWLRASVIVVRDSAPYCIPPEGAGHWVELERAA